MLGQQQKSRCGQTEVPTTARKNFERKRWKTKASKRNKNPQSPNES
jgi:hypothetical protein